MVEGGVGQGGVGICSATSGSGEDDACCLSKEDFPNFYLLIRCQKIVSALVQLQRVELDD